MAMERENRAPRAGGPNRKRKKVCQFCVDKCEYIDYKDAAKLRRFKMCIRDRCKTQQEEWYHRGQRLCLFMGTGRVFF